MLTVQPEAIDIFIYTVIFARKQKKNRKTLTFQVKKIISNRRYTWSPVCTCSAKIPLKKHF